MNIYRVSLANCQEMRVTRGLPIVTRDQSLKLYISITGSDP